MPVRRFSNQTPKQVLSHLKNLEKNLKYRMNIREDLLILTEAPKKIKKKSDLSGLLELVERELEENMRYNLQIGSFNASAEIKPKIRKPRSQRGNDKEKLKHMRSKMTSGDVKKFANKKQVKPKIRSQKAGRRMVQLKGQPGC